MRESNRTKAEQQRETQRRAGLIVKASQATRSAQAQRPKVNAPATTDASGRPRGRMDTASIRNASIRRPGC
ncbi:hypothetical protein [Marisediminicola antarctica]|uniref:Uncharacterized protein n=1 Tax=Marisediminicola antarctica TaxID=674079 RepID=A0A7L5ALI2_9MICO|nr:hypothetical protein [Marisediminicola antarctica]QHO69159.1 hypothetical protein BHD05_05340 [Marisediminicola antarctica]